MFSTFAGLEMVTYTVEELINHLKGSSSQKRSKRSKSVGDAKKVGGRRPIG